MVHTKSLDWGVMGDTWVSGQPCIHHGGREVGKREKRSDWPTWMMFPPQNQSPWLAGSEGGRCQRNKPTGRDWLNCLCLKLKVEHIYLSPWIDLRPEDVGHESGSLGDRSKSVPGLSVDMVSTLVFHLVTI